MYKSNEIIEEEFKKWVDERKSIPTSNECKEWFLAKRPESLQAIKEMCKEMKKEIEPHKCPEPLCSHYPRTEGYNQALDNIKVKLDELMK